MEQLEIDIQILKETREEQMEKMELLSQEVIQPILIINFSLNTK